MDTHSSKSFCAATALAKHQGWLRTVLLARLRDVDVVDEVMQEVAIAVIHQQSKSEPIEHPGPWLYRVALKQVLMYSAQSWSWAITCSSSLLDLACLSTRLKSSANVGWSRAVNSTIPTSTLSIRISPSSREQRIQVPKTMASTLLRLTDEPWGKKKRYRLPWRSWAAGSSE